MDARQRFVGLALSASLVSGAGVALGASAGASAPLRTAVTVTVHTGLDRAGLTLPRATTLPSDVGSTLIRSGAVTGGGAAARSVSTANRQFLPAWGIRLAVKAALEVIKKKSMSEYTKIIVGARAGEEAFMAAYAKLPGWVKAILPRAAVTALFEAVKWSVGL